MMMADEVARISIKSFCRLLSKTLNQPLEPGGRPRPRFSPPEVEADVFFAESGLFSAMKIMKMNSVKLEKFLFKFQ